MKTRILILLLTIPLPGIYSQVDPDATKTLDKVAQKMKSSEAWKIEFTYTIINKRDDTEFNQSGSIIMKGDKYILDLLGNKIYFDGEKNYNYIKDANEVTILPPEDNEDFFFTEPSKLFSFYKEGYKSQFTESTKIKNESFIDVDLFPEDLNKEYFKINILIVPDKYLIRYIKVFNKNGVQYDLELTSTTPVIVEDSKFTFNAKDFPKVEIIDMTE